MKNLSKIVVISGPTASGKTDLGIFLAKKFNGEVVNADSRQIYQEMDIGTGKPVLTPHLVDSETISKPPSLNGRGMGEGGRFVSGIRHHLFDIVRPDESYSVARWKEDATRVIKEILDRGHLPIVVGGTGLYVQAIVDNLKIPVVPPKQKLREEFAKKTPKELLEMLSKFDPDAAARLDPKNPRRIIRALEVSIWTGEPFSKQQLKGAPLYEVLQLGFDRPRDELYRRIDQRVDRMMANGWVEEVKKLLRKFPRTLPSLTGTGYQEIMDFLEGDDQRDEAKVELVQTIKYRTHQYARRQLSWLRRDKRIKWVKTKQEAEKLVGEFLGD